MNKKLVVDTGALALFFMGDTRIKPYFDAIEAKRAVGYMCSVNLAEYGYKTCQKLGSDTAHLRYQQIHTLLQQVEIDYHLSQAAADEKCRNNSLSLVDSFALALARNLKATLLTTDSELGKSKHIEVRLFQVKS
ncbi:MAG: PIN domain-containing protein [Thaumarchaeota archaeon]|nr:PIN domain-containing protein [Nitrososphaerota archaeon]